jgi:hypothetical protein
VEEYSLADLVEMTGAKPRSLQIWAERGVIQPIKSTSGAGTGVHRLFSRKEAIIACIIHPFAMRQMSIGELLNLSQHIRESYDVVPDPYEAAARGRVNTLFSVDTWYEKGKVRQSVIAGGRPSDFFTHSREPGAIRMTIRLETHLAKLMK